MKPAWDKLGESYAGSSVLIGDVDCTSDEGKEACNNNGVRGYPTIKYFTAETGKQGETYSGGRTFEALDAFVKEKLAKSCDVATKENCNDQESAYIDKFAAKGAEKIAAELKRLESMSSGDMQPEKKVWLTKRIALLKGLVVGSEEL